jgi:adiponectin receptor
VAHVSFSIIPLIHWITREGFYSQEVQRTLPKVLITFLLFGVGFFFYVSKLPERWYPGKFDIAFQSHQIWHVFVVIAACWQYYTIIAFLQPKIETGCPVP